MAHYSHLPQHNRKCLTHTASSSASASASAASSRSSSASSSASASSPASYSASKSALMLSAGSQVASAVAHVPSTPRGRAWCPWHSAPSCRRAGLSRCACRRSPRPRTPRRPPTRARCRPRRARTAPPAPSCPCLCHPFSHPSCHLRLRHLPPVRAPCA